MELAVTLLYQLAEALPVCLSVPLATFCERQKHFGTLLQLDFFMKFLTYVKIIKYVFRSTTQNIKLLDARNI